MSPPVRLGIYKSTGRTQPSSKMETKRGSSEKPTLVAEGCSTLERFQTKGQASGAGHNLAHILSNDTGEVFTQIFSHLNRTEYVNLLLTSRMIKDNIEGRPPLVFQNCQGIRAPVTDCNGQLLPDVARSTCGLAVQGTDTGLRACEGPSRFMTQCHGPTLEICGTCSNEALDVMKPRRHFVATPLCKPCSIAESSLHPPYSFVCKCLSPFSSTFVKARLCYDCRAEVQRQRGSQSIELMRLKLPILNPSILDASNDARRWRERSLVLLGYNRVGCRGCGANWEDLQKSYVSDNPAIPDEDLDDYTDESVQISKMRMMIFLCLDCDRHVSQYNATVNTYGTWGAV